jgi:F-box-like
MNFISSTIEDENTKAPSPDLFVEIARLTDASNVEIGKIHEAALVHRRELRKQIEWSMEEEEGDVEVRKIRLEREIERLVRERSGKVLTITEGPIHKLPIELLSYIFCSYVDCGMSPWRLAKVCKRWMRTALGTPHLWRYICVISPITHGTRHETWVVDGLKRVSMGRMQVCSTVVQLRAALRRSGAVPLEVHIEDLTHEGDDLSLVQIILGGPISKRIETLNLARMTLLKVAPGHGLSIGPFDLLKTIVLPTRLDAWAHAMLESICLTANRIESVRLNCMLSPELANYSFWSLLKALELNNSSTQFDVISQKLLNLENFPVALTHWPDQTTPVSTWTKVRQATIRCHPSHLDRARPPNLESLVFRDLRYYREVADTMNIYSHISYSSLTKLDVETPDLQWLWKLSLPSLIDLTVSCTSKSDIPPDEDIPAFTFPAVETLSLTTGWIDTVLVHTLSFFPYVSSIKLYCNQHKNRDFGLALLSCLDAKEQPLLCPNLASLSLGSIYYRVYTLKKNLGPLLKRLLNTRRKVGKPLQKLSVYWSKGSLTAENYV